MGNGQGQNQRQAVAIVRLEAGGWRPSPDRSKEEGRGGWILQGLLVFDKEGRGELEDDGGGEQGRCGCGLTAAAGIYRLRQVPDSALSKRYAEPGDGLDLRIKKGEKGMKSCQRIQGFWSGQLSGSFS